MARIFTTEFEYNHERYDALVTVLTENDELQIEIRLLDKELQRFIPAGRFSYRGLDGFEKLPDAGNAVSQAVRRKVGLAVRHHMCA